MKDLGNVQLKGLATPEAVFQVVHPKLYPNFPPLRELEATPNNLPQQLTTFIGRERERQEIEGLLATTRLLTLLGMGGLGKTRLALQIGAGVMDAYADGVWFIDLQTIRDPALVAGETARVLGVREEAGRPLMQTLCAHLKSRKLLLILDNCEQIIDASAELAGAILRAAADVRILTTSRTALRVPGEQTYLVQPLPVPARSGSFDALTESHGGPAVRRAGEAPQAKFRADGARGAGDCGARRATRRHSARARARSCAGAISEPRRNQQAPSGSLQAAREWRPNAPGAPENAARARRLVV